MQQPLLSWTAGDGAPNRGIEEDSGSVGVSAVGHRLESHIGRGSEPGLRLKVGKAFTVLRDIPEDCEVRV
jgi:hypothetical protein